MLPSKSLVVALGQDFHLNLIANISTISNLKPFSTLMYLTTYTNLSVSVQVVNIQNGIQFI